MPQAQALRTAVAATIGGYTALPILPARSPQVQKLVDADPEGARWEFVMPENGQAFELSIINDGEDMVRITYFAGPDQDAVVGGFPRLIPPGAQLIETRHAFPNDKIIIEDGGNADLDVVVHAHLAGVS